MKCLGFVVLFIATGLWAQSAPETNVTIISARNPYDDSRFRPILMDARNQKTKEDCYAEMKRQYDHSPVSYLIGIDIIQPIYGVDAAWLADPQGYAGTNPGWSCLAVKEARDDSEPQKGTDSEYSLEMTFHGGTKFDASRSILRAALVSSGQFWPGKFVEDVRTIKPQVCESSGSDWVCALKVSVVSVDE